MPRKMSLEITFEGGDLDDLGFRREVVEALKKMDGVTCVRYRTRWAGGSQDTDAVLERVDRWVKESLKFDQYPVHVYTDGGCRAKSTLGSYSYIVAGKDLQTRIEADTVTENVTNNRMELLAVIKALSSLEPGQKVLVTSDSKYVIDGSDYMFGWAKVGWQRNEKGVMVTVKNVDLWKVMFDLHRRHDVTFRHVPGHSGDFLNETVDMLCTLMMEEFLADKAGADQ